MKNVCVITSCPSRWGSPCFSLRASMAWWPFSTAWQFARVTQHMGRRLHPSELMPTFGYSLAKAVEWTSFGTWSWWVIHCPDLGVSKNWEDAPPRVVSFCILLLDLPSNGFYHWTDIPFILDETLHHFFLHCKIPRLILAVSQEEIQLLQIVQRHHQGFWRIFSR